ncbi:hypothetical protein DVH05_002045 [Phytophthora capsici]|nr:hypothetical protein DVH05_002045 [Phytophthora capsici]
MDGFTAGLLTQITEAFERYRFSMLPVTRAKTDQWATVGATLTRWKETGTPTSPRTCPAGGRAGFFAGGSRGNLGPGGSGSVVVEIIAKDGSVSRVWAAATALGRKDTTNNVAEFVGLQRLLRKAVDCEWRGL